MYSFLYLNSALLTFSKNDLCHIRDGSRPRRLSHSSRGWWRKEISNFYQKRSQRLFQEMFLIYYIKMTFCILPFSLWKTFTVLTVGTSSKRSIFESHLEWKHNSSVVIALTYLGKLPETNATIGLLNETTIVHLQAKVDEQMLVARHCTAIMDTILRLITRRRNSNGKKRRP